MRQFRVLLYLLPLFWLTAGSDLSAQSVNPAEVDRYLRQQIKIYYVGQPNRIYTGFIHELSPDNIASNTDGVLFGRGGNNRMSTSARFLLSLFRDRNRGGDGNLKDWVYLLLKVKDKPLKMYFHNDVMEPLSTLAVIRLGMDTVRIDDGLRVYPSVWGGHENPEAGQIDFGEAYFRRDLNLMKSVFIELLTGAAVSSYRSLHYSDVFSFTHPGIGNEGFYAGTAVMDSRHITSQGVCTAMAVTYDTTRQTDLYKWFQRPSFFVRRTAPDPRMEAQLSQSWLTAQSDFRAVGEVLQPLPAPPLRPEANQVFGWLNFSSAATRRDDMRVYKIRNELSQALLYNFYARKIGFQRLVRALAFNNQAFARAAPEQKFPVLLENLCQVAAQPGSSGAVRSTQASVAPVALIHFLAGAPENFSYADFSRLVGPGFPESLFNTYSAELRGQVTALSRRRSEAGLSWREVREELASVLQLN